MALIEGITASVIVNGEPLEEFNDGDDEDEVAGDDLNSDFDDEDQKYVDDKLALQDLVTTSRRRYFGPNRQVTKYIPSISGAEFVVKVSLSPDRMRRLKSEALQIKLSIDGNLFQSSIRRNGDYKYGFTFKNLVVATPAGPFQKPFLFSEIVTRDDDSDTADADKQEINVDKMGTILVQVFRLMVRKRSRPRSKTAKTTNTFIGDTFEGLQAVSEKKLKGKALSHFADLGPGKPYDHSSSGGSWRDSWQTHYIDGDIPISTFEFKYCSRKALKDMLIIPRTPSPSPPPRSPQPAARIRSPVRHEPVERPLDELSHEELLELARAQKAQLSIKAEVKPSIIEEVQASIKTEARESKLEPKTGIKRDRNDDADEDDFQITMSRSVRCKPAASQPETIKLDSDTEDEVSRPVTKSKPVISLKPPNSAAETITTIKPHGDADQSAATNSKSNDRPRGILT